MPEQSTTTLALAIWPPAGKHCGPGRYLAASRGKHPIPPELAARAILAYTDPGDLVVDPSCGAGSVLVEAIHNGRRAIGIAPDRRQAALATANVSHARQQGAPGRAAVLEGNPDQLPHLLAKAAAIHNPPPASGRVRRHPAGSTQLILTTAPPLPGEALLSTWASVLAPGAFLMLVHPQHTGAARVGLGRTVAAAEQARLLYWQHVIALHATAASQETSEALLLHTDVLSFRKPHADHDAGTSRRVGGDAAVAA